MSTAVLSPRRFPDPWLCGPAAVLLVLGLMMTLNTTYFISLARAGTPFRLFVRQLASLGLGILAAAFMASLSGRGLRRIALPLAVAAGAMLAAVAIPGVGLSRGGARRWLGVGSVTVQPSEIAKLAWVFFLARMLSRKGLVIEDWRTGLLPAVAALLPVVVLILLEPDFGAAVMLCLVLVAMLFGAGARLSHLMSLVGLGSLGLGYQAIHRAYRLQRLLAFLDPWRVARSSGFQLVQSLIAFGAGGSFGVGLGAGNQKMFFLPEAHTDFVFAVLGEETGLLGTLTVVAMYTIIVVRGMRIARREEDLYLSLLGAGITTLLALQAAINMAVTTGLAPTKGLPLPFMSYGGTAMVTSLAALGVLLGLSRREQKS